MAGKFDNPICQQCIADHMEKYKDFVDDNGDIYNEFSVPCEGIQTDYLWNKWREILTEEQQADAIAILDPVEWAKKYAIMTNGKPWVARWYQERLLRCTSERKVTRLGRRSGKTDAIAIHIMWQCFTNDHKRVLIIAPYKAQAEEIIGRIRSFLSMNPALGNAVERDVSSPYYEIKLRNGSTIRGFSSGTKSGNDAAAVRGQDADAIYLDEADYLSSNDLGAIVAILNTHPHVTLWSSSTPKGSREHFYNWCTNSPTYKEFKYPSSVLPHWDEIKDKFRADYAGRPDDWTHEILAEFGEQSIGVFQNAFIDRAITAYKYEEQRPQPGWIYSIGVDWNKEVGTEIVVAGYNPMKHKFRIVESLNVPKQEFTQVKGMEAVISMNEKWRPAFVYVDEGGGGTNIELLRKYGYDMIARDSTDPGCQFISNLKAYNFSAKLEVHDPINGVPIKKDAKPFMVENTVRRFEENTIEISAYDTRLKRQLENYIIDHYTPTGRAVYGQLDEKIGDHRLDAAMLSLVAYKLEISDFARPTFSTKIAISGGFDSHGGDGKNAEQVARDRQKQMPGSRFELDDESQVFTDNLPAMTGESRLKTNKPGWDTDEEVKYEVKFRMERIKKRLLRRVFRPTRKNI